MLWYGKSSLTPETVVVHSAVSKRKLGFSKYTRATEEELR